MAQQRRGSTDDSIDSFKVPTSDEKGHNVHIAFRCMPLWAGHLDKIVSSQKFPYVSRGDVIKHAILRHFHWLEALEEVPGSVLGQIQLMVDLIEDDLRQQGFETVMEGLKERVSYHMNNGDLGQARRQVLQATKCVEEMPRGFWRDKFQRELKRGYKELMGTAPKARLNKVQKEEEETGG